MAQNIAARIDDRVDPGAGVMQIERRHVGAIVGGEHDCLLAYQYAVPVQERAGPVGEHDAWAVVVGEHHGSLVRARGDHDVTGTDPPHSLPADGRRRVGAEVVGPALQRQDESVIVVTERCGALQMQNLWERGEFGYCVGHPLQCGLAVDGVGASEQCTTGLALFVDEHHPCARTGCGQGGRQAGRASPRDQHVGMHVGRVVLCGVGNLCETPLAGNAARHQSVEQFDRRREQHGLGEGLFNLDQAPGVLGPGRGEPAGPAQLDARGDLVDTVGQQGRSKCVADAAGELPSIENEGAQCITVYAAALGSAERCVHQIFGFCSSTR
ncbi:Uncharacterised protein [Mycobacteroides abscessus subsp. bolletii]|nr:Uncharacterised protein [Mycobacteroides abscessus subsp. bolletii]